MRQGLPARPGREPAKAAGTLKAPAAAADPALNEGDPGTRSETGLDETPPPEQNDPDRERILRLQEALTSIVHGPVLGRHARGRAGDRSGHRAAPSSGRRGADADGPGVEPEGAGHHRGLMRLGADYHFRTELSGPAPDADGVVAGDVVLRGSGDPSLELAELEAMAAELASRGVIRRIEGGVLSDQRRLGVARGLGATSARRCGSAARRSMVRVRPGAEGAAPLVVVRPSIDAIVVRNRAKTQSKARGRIRVTLSNGAADGRHDPGRQRHASPPATRAW